MKNHSSGFTLVELLIVIGILAVIGTTAVVILNPAQLLAQARDGQRISDIQALNRAIDLSITLNNNIGLGPTNTCEGESNQTIYVSVPSDNGEASPIVSDWTYGRVVSDDLRKLDGDGWLPIDFLSVGNTPLSKLPVDPTNTFTSGYYYTYVCGSYELGATLESNKHSQLAKDDGGDDVDVFELGTDLSITLKRCENPLIDSRNGKSYTTVRIGSQCWMAENINIGTRINGTNEQADNGTIEKYCYNNTESNCTSDGGLYKWSEAMQYSTSQGAQGICPNKWHIPTDNEWMTLEENLGMCSGTGSGCSGDTEWRGTDQGTKLKQGGSSGFEALFAGFRSTNGSFFSRDEFAFFWSSSDNSTLAYRRYLVPGNSTVYRDAFNKNVGWSVRCLKD